jgi:hypothetical protein
MLEGKKRGGFVLHIFRMVKPDGIRNEGGEGGKARRAPLRGRTTEGWVSRYTLEVWGRGHRHNGAPPDIRVAVPKGRRRNHGEVTDSEHTGHCSIGFGD